MPARFYKELQDISGDMNVDIDIDDKEVSKEEDVGHSQPSPEDILINVGPQLFPVALTLPLLTVLSFSQKPSPSLCITLAVVPFT